MRNEIEAMTDAVDLDALVRDGEERYATTWKDKTYKTAKRNVQRLQDGMKLQVDIPKSVNELRERYAMIAVRHYASEQVIKRLTSMLRKQEVESEDLEIGLEEILNEKIRLAQENERLKKENEFYLKENTELHRKCQDMAEYINLRSKR